MPDKLQFIVEAEASDVGVRTAPPSILLAITRVRVIDVHSSPRHCPLQNRTMFWGSSGREISLGRMEALVGGSRAAISSQA